jgi:hypothetical protein
MEAFIKDINEAIEDYKTLQENMRIKYESTTTTRDALYTLRMRANEEQQKVIDALTESFKDDIVDLENMTKQFNEKKPKLESFDTEVYNSLHSLFLVYASLHSTLGKENPLTLDFMDNIVLQLKKNTGSTIISVVEDSTPIAFVSSNDEVTTATPFQIDNGVKSAPFCTV